MKSWIDLVTTLRHGSKTRGRVNVSGKVRTGHHQEVHPEVSNVCLEEASEGAAGAGFMVGAEFTAIIMFEGVNGSYQGLQKGFVAVVLHVYVCVVLRCACIMHICMYINIYTHIYVRACTHVSGGQC